TIDPKRDLSIIDGEFLISDLITVENRLSKLSDELRIKGKKAEGEVQPQIEMMNKLKDALENEIPLRDLDLSADDVKSLKGYGFLWLKPVIVVFNTGEGQELDPKVLEYPHKNSFATALQGKLEAEIAQLEGDEAEMF